MDRAELSEALREWRGRGMGAESTELDVGSAAPRLVCAPTAEQFMTAFAEAVAGAGDVLLCDPRWGATEKSQVAELLRAQTAAANSPLRAPNSAGLAPRSDLGWLGIPTGGTSGGLRFARHDGFTLAAAVRGFVRHFGLARVNSVGVLPLHHVSGLMAWLRGVFTGGEYWPLDWKAVEAGAYPPLPATVDGWTLSLVPTQLERLSREARAVEWLRHFRLICLGGGPAWPELLDRAAAQRLPLSPGYGLTESAAMAAALPPEEFLAGGRSCGPALPHVALTIGSDGAVTLEGESLFRGYYPAWRAAGPFVTGDAGRLEARARLQILGRRDAVIITGGEKVDPGEVEAVLRGTGDFADVVVVGLPDAEWGQVVVAAYPASARPDLERAARLLEERLPAYKQPKRFVPVSAWPVNEQGKVNRLEVARRAAGS